MNTRMTEDDAEALIADCRQAYHEGKLTGYQTLRLERIPGWTWGTPIPKKVVQDAPTRLRESRTAGFWRSDVVSGDDRGFVFVSDDPRVADMVQAALNGFAALPPAEKEEMLTTEIYDQLRESSDLMWSTVSDGVFRPSRLNREDLAYVIVAGLSNIAILEAYGRLIPDEFNGMQYIHANAPDAYIDLMPGGGKTIMFPGIAPRRWQ